MLWAIKEGERIKAIPNDKALCPLCKKEVISKCGKIKIWHWSHRKDYECDSFSEPETEWHFSWKKLFPKENQEVNIENHRADIRTNKGIILELQNSSISPEEIMKREEFYKNLIWIINGKTIGKHIEFFKLKFKWKWHQSFYFARKPIYVDKGDSFLYLLNLSSSNYQKFSKDAFIIEYGGLPQWSK